MLNLTGRFYIKEEFDTQLFRLGLEVNNEHRIHIFKLDLTKEQLDEIKAGIKYLAMK